MTNYKLNIGIRAREVLEIAKTDDFGGQLITKVDPMISIRWLRIPDTLSFK